MKLVTLNIWGGRINSKFEEFFGSYKDVDMWCFQEVFKSANKDHHLNITKFEPHNEIFDVIGSLLPAFQGEFMQTFKNTYGLATFLHPSIKIIEKGETLIARGKWNDNPVPDELDHHRKLQWFELEKEGEKFVLVNAHLTHRPEGKRDSEKRIKQSRIIVDFLSMFPYPKILVGDFNLLPDTESIKMIEDSGMRNLIKEFGVTSTRTELYEKPLRFADYIFTSPEIKVNDFKVLPDVVSDHSPVFIDFEV